MEYLFLNSPAAVADAVRTHRVDAGWTQGELALKAHVGRRFVHDLETGHPRAELGKVLAVLEALDIHATALPSTPTTLRRSDISLSKSLERFA